MFQWTGGRILMPPYQPGIRSVETLEIFIAHLPMVVAESFSM